MTLKTFCCGWAIVLAIQDSGTVSCRNSTSATQPLQDLIGNLTQCRLYNHVVFTVSQNFTPLWEMSCMQKLVYTSFVAILCRPYMCNFSLLSTWCTFIHKLPFLLQIYCFNCPILICRCWWYYKGLYNCWWYDMRHLNLQSMSSLWVKKFCHR